MKEFMNVPVTKTDLAMAIEYAHQVTPKTINSRFSSKYTGHEVHTAKMHAKLAELAFARFLEQEYGAKNPVGTNPDAFNEDVNTNLDLLGYKLELVVTNMKARYLIVNARKHENKAAAGKKPDVYIQLLVDTTDRIPKLYIGGVISEKKLASKATIYKRGETIPNTRRPMTESAYVMRLENTQQDWDAVANYITSHPRA